MTRQPKFKMGDTLYFKFYREDEHELFQLPTIRRLTVREILTNNESFVYTDQRHLVKEENECNSEFKTIYLDCVKEMEELKKRLDKYRAEFLGKIKERKKVLEEKVRTTTEAHTRKEKIIRKRKAL